MQIYLARDHQQAGPYSVEQLNQMLTAQQVLLTDLIWHVGMQEWKPLGEVTQGQLHYYPTSNETLSTTPQQIQNTITPVETTYTLAPISKRAVAKFIDLLLWMPALVILQLMLSTEQHLEIAKQQQHMLTLISQDKIEQANQLSFQILNIIPSTAWTVMAVYLLAMLIVQAVLLSKTGQSVGKKIMAIQIVDLHNQQLVGLNRVFILRSILFMILNIFVAPFVFIFDWIFAIGKKRQALHDYLAKTIVTNKK
ncbi:MAG: RDD family protein [Acinetobacter sp.]|jgi:uncharacterized RDD family membrane protein YckC|nr:MAG: RDD family protein [Acinetobacter sp.]